MCLYKIHFNLICSLIHLQLLSSIQIIFYKRKKKNEDTNNCITLIQNEINAEHYEYNINAYIQFDLKLVKIIILFMQRTTKVKCIKMEVSKKNQQRAAKFNKPNPNSIENKFYDKNVILHIRNYATFHLIKNKNLHFL